MNNSESTSDGFIDDTVWVVQQALLNLLDMIDSFANANEEVNRLVLREDAEQTILALTSAIILADGKCDKDEKNFIRHLVGDESDVDMGNLNDYAARWNGVSKSIPTFFRAAVQYDLADGAGIAASMLREIQFIGNNVCISNREFEVKERECVVGNIERLEEFMLEGRNADTTCE